MYTDFAWECLRRNADYIYDWKMYSSSLNNNKVRGEMLRNLELKWGLLIYADPTCSTAKHVFWREEKSTRSIRVKLHKRGDIASEKITNSNSRVSVETLLLDNNDICLKRYNSIGYCQIFIDNDDFKSISSGKYIYFSMKGGNFGNILGFLNDTFVPSNPCSFRMDALNAYDKISQGYTQREVAISTYGEKLVNNEWGNDGWLRARIRYKLKIAKSLIYNDYLKYT